MGFLIHSLFQPHSLFRAQIAIIIAGILIPIFGTLLTLLGIQFSPWQNPLPLTIAVGNLVIVAGIYRYQIFEIVPVGRDKIFEDMMDPAVILDNKNNIVDINNSMLVLLDKTSQEVIGKPGKIVFDKFPIPIKMYTVTKYARTEAIFELGGLSIHYEMTIWPLFNSHKELIGRVYVSHDITALKHLEQKLRELNIDLEKRVRTRTQELAEAYDTTLEGWSNALELRDKEIEGHSHRVTDITLKIARAMGIDNNSLDHIRRGALLHDIGKMGIPDEILHKTSDLTDEERALVQMHPEIARKLLAPIPFLQKALEIPYYHHEKWDGTGYPLGLKGHSIPMAARIFAIADVWDAITSDRPYNKAWSREKAITYFIEESGKHFDRRIVNVFLDLVEKGEI
jgi:putative nucleotidyltransferase with HDIG domain/PAS domain S-box-containing protein